MTVTAFLAWGWSGQDLVAQLPTSTSDAVPEVVAPFEPKSKRSEADEDRLAAAAKFAHARLLAGRDDTDEALRQLQRAWRLDPSPPIAQEIVSLAGSLNREEIAFRYALAAAELHPPEPELALKLAMLLAEQDESDRAIQFLKRVVERDGGLPQGLPAVLCRAELARLALLAQQPSVAVQAGAVVLTALASPNRFGLSVAEQEQLARQRERLETVLGEAFFLTGRFDDAEKLFEQLETRRPNETLRVWRAARIAWKRSDLPRAGELLDAYFRGKGTIGGLEPYLLLRQLLEAELNDPRRAAREARVRLEAYLQQDPRNLPLGFSLAELRFADEDWKGAAALFEELLEREPTATAYQQLTRIYLRQDQPTEFVKLLARSVDQGDGWEIVRKEFSAFEKREETLRKVVDLLRTPAANQPTPWGMGAFIGGSLLALEAGQVEEAADLVARALQLPQVDAAKVRETVALGALVLEKPDLAVPLLRDALEVSGVPAEKQAAYWYYLAAAWELGGKTDEALRAAEKCRELRPESAPFHAREAWVLYHAERWEQADAKYRAFLTRFDPRTDGEETREQVRQAKLIVSNLCVRADRLEEAEEWLEQVLDEYPGDEGALNDLGYLWADQGKRLERALGMIQRAVTAEPENASYRDSLGWAYYRLGRFAEAVRELEQASRESPDGIIFDHLGDAYAGLPDSARAVAAWKQGIELLKLPSESSQREKIAAKLRKFTKSSPTDSPK